MPEIVGDPPEAVPPEGPESEAVTVAEEFDGRIGVDGDLEAVLGDADGEDVQESATAGVGPGRVERIIAIGPPRHTIATTCPALTEAGRRTGRTAFRPRPPSPTIRPAAGRARRRPTVDTIGPRRHTTLPALAPA